MSDDSLLAEYSHHIDTAKALKVTDRTLRRYEHMPNGLPYVMIGGKKYHHIPTTREWIMKRMCHPNPRRAA